MNVLQYEPARQQAWPVLFCARTEFCFSFLGPVLGCACVITQPGSNTGVCGFIAAKRKDNSFSPAQPTRNLDETSVDVLLVIRFWMLARTSRTNCRLLQLLGN